MPNVLVFATVRTAQLYQWLLLCAKKDRSARSQSAFRTVRPRGNCLSRLHLPFIPRTKPTAWIAVIGIFTSELCVVLFCLFFLLWNHQKSKLLLFPIQEPFGHLRRLMGMYLPLTTNRLIMTFLASAEAILIPSRLLIFGYTSSTALSIYGVLTGMALPMVLFPSAVTKFYLCDAATLPSLSSRLSARKNKSKRPSNSLFNVAFSWDFSAPHFLQCLEPLSEISYSIMN